MLAAGAGRRLCGLDCFICRCFRVGCSCSSCRNQTIRLLQDEVGTWSQNGRQAQRNLDQKRWKNSGLALSWFLQVNGKQNEAEKVSVPKHLHVRVETQRVTTDKNMRTPGTETNILQDWTLDRLTEKCFIWVLDLTGVHKCQINCVYCRERLSKENDKLSKSSTWK